MKVVIIEDERVGARKLKRMLLAIDPTIRFVAVLESVAEAKEWFAHNQIDSVDLFFSDIQLSDGLAFEIFEDIDTLIPIIFTTAYDDYAIRAFKLNGVDYLLKPIQEKELINALKKFEKTRGNYSGDQLSQLQHLMAQFQQSVSGNLNFISYRNDKLIPIACENIVCFYTKNNVVFAVTQKADYIIDECMEDIEARLPKNLFYRANRQYIVQRKFIENARQHTNGRLILTLSASTPEDIIISREKVAQFKGWLTY
jgi:two-component system, LytTR family, response regulator LytT